MIFPFFFFFQAPGKPFFQKFFTFGVPKILVYISGRQKRNIHVLAPFLDVEFEILVGEGEGSV
jgi:hypothetical protein